jgi:phosphoribosylformylglycinamidine synthase
VAEVRQLHASIVARQAAGRVSAEQSFQGQEPRVARVVVHVMPKTVILDPQGQAIVGALGRLGVAGISDVRQGKRFELEVDDGVSDETLAEIAESLLANTVIEDWTVTREDQ